MIRVEKDGVRFECDSVDEAVAIMRELATKKAHRSVMSTAAHDGPPQEARAVPATLAGAWRQPPALDVFWGRLDSRGRTAIQMIATNDSVSIDELRAELKLPSTKQVSHVLAAVKRVAASVNIPDWRDVFTYTISGARGERVSLYCAGSLLREEV